MNQGHNVLGHVDSFDALLAPPAVVTHPPTVGWVERLTEEGELHAPPAKVRLFAVIQRCVESLQVFSLTRGRVARCRDEEVEDLAVAVLVVQYALSLFLVPTCAATLLCIALEASREGVVDDESDISLVDAHSKSDRSYDDSGLVLHPPALDLLSTTDRQVGVVEVTRHLVITFESLSKPLAILARYAVDEPTLTLEARVEQGRHIVVYVVKRLLVSDFEEQVRPVEAALEIKHRVCYPEDLRDVVLDLYCSCGGEAKQGYFRELPPQGAQVEVILTEVLAPVRAAVDLVYHESIDLVPRVKLSQSGLKSRTASDFLRSHVHYLVA